MSAFFDADQHLGDIHEAALKLAPICTGFIDYTSPEHHKMVAERAWKLGETFVEQYYRKVEEASERAAVEENRRLKQAHQTKEAAHV
jgi:aminoglycoside phosphotransferase family enzyme